MKERRRGQFDLIPFCQLAIERHDLADYGSLKGEDLMLLLFCIAPILVPQCSQPWIATDGAESEPGEVEPDLKVEIFLSRELFRHMFQLRPRCFQAPCYQQLVVARERTDHRGPVGRKIVPNQKSLFIRLELFGRPSGMFEE